MKIKLEHKVVDGAHFITSGNNTEDDKLIGLCIAHMDLGVVMADCIPVIQYLLQENHGIKDYPAEKIQTAIDEALAESGEVV